MSFDEPAPWIEAGLNPALETPGDNPFSLLTLRLTSPPNPVRAWVATVNVADWPGEIATEVGVTEMEKSGLLYPFKGRGLLLAVELRELTGNINLLGMGSPLNLLRLCGNKLKANN